MSHNFPDTYELLQECPLTDIKSQGFLLRHKKSGARVAIIQNEDENKVFYVGFRTPVSDSTGVAHITEHTVLCGSEKYPVKDPFVELVKGSMNTFLNAMTYPDKTVYPVASVNDKDFKNLCDVYMDAVFHPNIYRFKEIFRQEGWHYELNDPEGELTINGVVYNEMKGAFSSPEGVLDRLILNSLHPDTGYGFESGGDPEDIPSLTYEAYLDFHRRFYHPSNSYIYLYGNMDVNERLVWMDRDYLSAFDSIDPDSEIKLQKSFTAIREIRESFPVTSDEEEKENTYLALNYSVGDALDLKLCTAFDILDYALLSRPGAPLKQALLDAGIGKDIMGGFDSGTRQPMFSIIAKYTEADKKEDFCRVIRETLEKEAERGIPEKTLLAGINSSEFRFREADYGSYPKGLIYGLDMLESWLYDDNLPFATLQVLPIYQELREDMKRGYFEDLIRTWLLKNPYGSLITVSPEKGLNEKKDAAQAEKLERYKETLSREEREKLVEETRALLAYQEEESPQEELSKIPMLERGDIDPKIKPLYNQEVPFSAGKALWHEINTNGIAYIHMLFDTTDLTEEEYRYLGILKAVLGYMDTESLGYRELSDEINLYTGGISCGLNVVNKVALGETGEFFEVKAKCLYSNLEETRRLLSEILFATDFSDHKRLYEIIAEGKSRMQMSLPSSGNSTASIRAMSYFSRLAKIQDLAGGIDLYRLVDRIEGHFEEEKTDLIQRLSALSKKVLSKKRLLLSITMDREGKELALPILETLCSRLSEEAPGERRAFTMAKKNEGFMDASKVQYVARAGNFKDAGLPYTGALRILKTILSYDYLWQNIRVKGGAYGCMSGFTRNGDSYFASYRDPNLTETNAIYEGIPEYVRSFEVSERDMTKYIIGTISSMDTPLTPDAKGNRSAMAYISGFEEERLKKERDEILSADTKSIRDLAPYMEAILSEHYICAIGNDAVIGKEENLFSNKEKLL